MLGDDGALFAGAISTAHRKGAWKASVLVNGHKVESIDTGADVTVVPASLLARLKEGDTLLKSDMLLLGPAKQRLEVLGAVPLTVTFNGTSVKANLYVTKDLNEPLLGLDLIESLDILRQVNGACAEPCLDPVSEYLELFQGLREAPYACKIKLKSEAEPFALASPRRIPVPLLKAVERQLRKMEGEGVITSVSEPTDWCSLIVVVPKKNGDVRICVDYIMLDKSVQR